MLELLLLKEKVAVYRAILGVNIDLTNLSWSEIQTILIM
jgi:hypothetical protein